MTGKYLAFTFPALLPEQSEMLIARLNDALQTEGFEEEEAMLTMYIKEEHFNQQLFNAIVGPGNLQYVQASVENKNWNEVWETNFEAVLVENLISVRAVFHKPVPGVPFDIVITPKMSFGTGHHATTYMMLDALYAYNCLGKKVADFGTGTGVLAILAAQMKAADVLAIDYDDWSIENAAENIACNNTNAVRLMKADEFPEEGGWDLILANINLHVILANMHRLAQGLVENGTLIISGILAEDQDAIQTEALKNNFLQEKVQQKNNWVCMTFKKRNVL